MLVGVFLGALILMCLVVGYMILVPLFRAEDMPLISRRGSRVALLRDQYRGHLAEQAMGSDSAEPAKSDAATEMDALGRHLLVAAEAARSVGDNAASLPVKSSPSMQRGIVAAYALGLLMVLGGYFVTGSPGLIGESADQLAARRATIALSEIIRVAERRLAVEPDDVRGWRAVAPVYRSLGRFEDTARAWRHVLRLEGADATVLTHLAEALLLAESRDPKRSILDEAEEILIQARELGERSGRATYYLGVGAALDAHPERAALLWRTALAQDDAIRAGRDDIPPPLWRAAAKQALHENARTETR